MPKLPDKFSIRDGSVPNARRSIVTPRGGALAGALQGVGEDIARVGKVIERREAEEDDLNIARARSHFLTGKIKLEAGLDEDPDHENWDKKYAEGLGTLRNEAAKLISNPKSRERFTLASNDDFARGVAFVQGRKKERQKEVGLADLDTTVATNMDALLLAQDEPTRAGLLDTVSQAWDGAVKRGWVPPAVAAQKKRAFAEAYGEKRLDMMPAAERLRLLGGAAPGSGSDKDYEAKVQKFESAGQDGAVNPDTKATGRFQFIDSTWLSQISRHAPEAAEGKTKEQILALRSDPVVAQRVFAGFTRDNEVALAAAGVPVNDTTRYLAHWFGAAGASQLMQADPKQSIAAFLPTGKSPTGKSWAAANGIEGKSVGEVIGIAEQRMGGKSVKMASLGGTMTDAAPTKTGTFVDLIPVAKRIDIQQKAAKEYELEQAAGRVERETQAVQQTTETLFSQHGFTPEGEAKALAYIRANSTGKAQNSLITAYTGRAAEARRIDNAATDGVFDTALQKVWAGKASEITPQEQASLEKKGQWDKIGAEIVAFQSGNQKATDWQWLHENYLSKPPAEQAKVPLATLKEFTSRSEYEKIKTARKELAEDDPGQRSVSEHITARLKPLKLDPKNEKDAARVDAFHTELGARIGAWQTKNGMKMPPAEQKKLVDELTGKLAIERPGWFNNDVDAPVFVIADPNSKETKRISADTGIPADQLPAVFRAMSERKIKPTIDNIKKVWEEGTQ